MAPYLQQLLLAGALAQAAASVSVSKVGIYDYFTDESTPVVYNGHLLMFESIVQNSPQWAGHWDPRFANCTSYYRVRDQTSGVVIVNLTQTCEHAFGFALVQTNDEGLDTFFIFGTAWIRAQATHENSTSLGWSGPCSTNNCSVDAFYTSDPALQSWATAGQAIHTGYSVYNTDIAHVGVPGASTEGEGSGLPPHQWVMIMETSSQASGKFWLSNASDPTDPTGWFPLDTSLYTLDQFGNWQVGACPSIRFDPATGYYYVLTGGYQIIALRSKTLAKGSWELANNNGIAIAPDAGDCKLAGTPYGAWFNLSAYPDAEAHVDACLADPAGPGFGNDSDIDLTEVIVSTEWLNSLLGPAAAGAAAKGPNGSTSVATLVQYGSGDQKTFGFSNLAIYPGPMFGMLASFFNASS